MKIFNSTNIDNLVVTLVDVLHHQAITQPNKIVYRFLEDGKIESDKLTYQELEWQARVIAGRLQNLGLAGERALLIYPPGLAFIPAFLGCLCAGVVPVPLPPIRPNQKGNRLQEIVHDAAAKLVLTTEMALQSVKQKFEEACEGINLDWWTTDTINNEWRNNYRAVSLKPDHIAFLQYTSGSTGTPKGVMVSHGNLLHNAAVIQHHFGTTTESIGISWLPLYHDMGLIGSVIQTLYTGGSMVLMSPVAFFRNPVQWLQAISDYQATISGGPNFAYDLCVKKTTPQQRANLNLSSWKVAFNGSEPIRSQTLQQFFHIFSASKFHLEAFFSCYGMAETTLLVTCSDRATPPTIHTLDATALEQNRVLIADKSEKNTRSVTSCGYAAPDQQIAIIDPNTKKRCLPDQVGEIWIASPSVAQGYWNQAEATQATFAAYLTDTQEGPFLRTGDLGFLRDGELFITGRLKEVVIIRGRNHYPQDIELTVEQTHLGLRPGYGAAFAIEADGEERLVVIQEAERSFLSKLNVEEVVLDIRQAVVAEHGVQVYAIMLVKPGSIPKTSSGKNQRRLCRERFLQGMLISLEDSYART